MPPLPHPPPVCGTRMRTGVGVDGCRGGWVGVWLFPAAPPRWQIAADIEDLWRHGPTRGRWLIDMPIGLIASGSGRLCDAKARSMLPPGRRSSIFPAPARPVLACDTYEEANACNRTHLERGLSRQSWNLVPRIRQLDDFLEQSPSARQVFRESHPELCFSNLSGGALPPKKSAEGRSSRIDQLDMCMPGFGTWVAEQIPRIPRRLAQPDDLLDAAVLALVAGWPGRLRSLPPRPPRDERDLPMRLVIPPLAF